MKKLYIVEDTSIEPYIANLSSDGVIQANDLVVLATSIDLENAPIITFDKKMRNKFNQFHKNIFYCLDKNDGERFLKLLNNY